MKLVELDDGSGFMLANLPLPKDHWIYEKREYKEHVEGTLGYLVTQETYQDLKQKVQTAVKLAIQGATMSGKDMDFDPDALVQNAVVELLGHNRTSEVLEKI